MLGETTAASEQPSLPQELLVETHKEREMDSREVAFWNKLGGGANETRLAKLKEDGSVVFKPKTGEKPELRKNIEAGTYYKRERAAYLIDKFFNLGLVPPTIIRELDGEEGSVQEFVPDASVALKFAPETVMQVVSPEDTLKLALFDILVWNSDRHFGNLLLRRSAEKKYDVFAIDHGLAFGDTFLRCYGYGSFQEVFYGKEIGPALQESMKRISDPESMESLRALLSDLLPEEDVARFLGRCAIVRKWIEQGKAPDEATFLKELNLGYTQYGDFAALTDEATVPN